MTRAPLAVAVTLSLLLPACKTTVGEGDALFFDSPQGAVTRIQELLVAGDWGTLARYYDLTDSPVSRETLESGEFFYTDVPPATVHPAGFWHYLHPFPPAFGFDSARDADDQGTVEITVTVEIDQGGGMIQRGRMQFWMRRSAAGYQVLPIPVD